MSRARYSGASRNVWQDRRGRGSWTVLARGLVAAATSVGGNGGGLAAFGVVVCRPERGECWDEVGRLACGCCSRSCCDCSCSCSLVMVITGRSRRLGPGPTALIALVGGIQLDTHEWRRRSHRVVCKFLLAFHASEGMVTVNSAWWLPQSSRPGFALGRH